MFEQLAKLVNADAALRRRRYVSAAMFIDCGGDGTLVRIDRAP